MQRADLPTWVAPHLGAMFTSSWRREHWVARDPSRESGCLAARSVGTLLAMMTVVQKQLSVPGGHIGVYEQTLNGSCVGFTAHLVLNGTVVKTAEASTASKAIADVATWLHGLTAAVSEIATKLRFDERDVARRSR